MNSEQTLEITLTGGAPWGFRLSGGEGAPLIVDEVNTESAAHRQGILKGDNVVSINEVDVQNKEQAGAMAILASAANTLTLTIVRNKVSKNSSKTDNKEDDGSEGLFIVSDVEVGTNEMKHTESNGLLVDDSGVEENDFGIGEFVLSATVDDVNSATFLESESSSFTAQGFSITTSVEEDASTNNESLDTLGGIIADVTVEEESGGITADMNVAEASGEIIADVTVEEAAEGITADVTVEEASGEIIADVTVEEAAEGITADVTVEEAAEGITADMTVEEASGEIIADVTVEEAAGGITADVTVEETSGETIADVTVEEAAEGITADVIVEQVSKDNSAEVTVGSASESVTADVAVEVVPVGIDAKVTVEKVEGEKAVAVKNISNEISADVSVKESSEMIPSDGTVEESSTGALADMQKEEISGGSIKDTSVDIIANNISADILESALEEVAGGISADVATMEPSLDTVSTDEKIIDNISADVLIITEESKEITTNVEAAEVSGNSSADVAIEKVANEIKADQSVVDASTNLAVGVQKVKTESHIYKNTAEVSNNFQVIKDRSVSSTTKTLTPVNAEIVIPHSKPADSLPNIQLPASNVIRADVSPSISVNKPGSAIAAPPVTAKFIEASSSINKSSTSAGKATIAPSPTFHVKNTALEQPTTKYTKDTKLQVERKEAIRVNAVSSPATSEQTSSRAVQTADNWQSRTLPLSTSATNETKISSFVLKSAPVAAVSPNFIQTQRPSPGVQPSRSIGSLSSQTIASSSKPSKFIPLSEKKSNFEPYLVEPHKADNKGSVVRESVYQVTSTLPRTGRNVWRPNASVPEKHAPEVQSPACDTSPYPSLSRSEGSHSSRDRTTRKTIYHTSISNLIQPKTSHEESRGLGSDPQPRQEGYIRHTFATPVENNPDTSRHGSSRLYYTDQHGATSNKQATWDNRSSQFPSSFSYDAPKKPYTQTVQTSKTMSHIPSSAESHLARGSTTRSDTGGRWSAGNNSEPYLSDEDLASYASSDDDDPFVCKNYPETRHIKVALTPVQCENIRLHSSRSDDNSLTPDMCLGIASDLKEHKGRGGRLFQRRKQRVDKFIVDDQTVQGTNQLPNFHATKSATLPAMKTPWERAVERSYIATRSPSPSSHEWNKGQRVANLTTQTQLSRALPVKHVDTSQFLKYANFNRTARGWNMGDEYLNVDRHQQALPGQGLAPPRVPQRAQSMPREMISKPWETSTPQSWEATTTQPWKPTTPKLWEPTTPKLWEPTTPKPWEPTTPKLWEPTAPKFQEQVMSKSWDQPKAQEPAPERSREQPLTRLEGPAYSRAVRQVSPPSPDADTYQHSFNSKLKMWQVLGKQEEEQAASNERRQQQRLQAQEARGRQSSRQSRWQELQAAKQQQPHKQIHILDANTKYQQPDRTDQWVETQAVRHQERGRQGQWLKTQDERQQQEQPRRRSQSADARDLRPQQFNERDQWSAAQDIRIHQQQNQRNSRAETQDSRYQQPTRQNEWKDTQNVRYQQPTRQNEWSDTQNVRYQQPTRQNEWSETQNIRYQPPTRQKEGRSETQSVRHQQTSMQRPEIRSVRQQPNQHGQWLEGQDGRSYQQESWTETSKPNRLQETQGIRQQHAIQQQHWDETVDARHHKPNIQDHQWSETQQARPQAREHISKTSNVGPAHYEDNRRYGSNYSSESYSVPGFETGHTVARTDRTYWSEDYGKVAYRQPIIPGTDL